MVREVAVQARDALAHVSLDPVDLALKPALDSANLLKQCERRASLLRYHRLATVLVLVLVLVVAVADAAAIVLPSTPTPTPPRARRSARPGTRAARPRSR